MKALESGDSNGAIMHLQIADQSLGWLSKEFNSPIFFNLSVVSIKYDKILRENSNNV